MADFINFSDPSTLNGWITKGNWEDLESYLKSIPKEEFRSWEYLAQGLLSLYKYRDVVSALLHLEKACQLSPDESRFFNTFSDILLKAKQIEKSLEVAKESVSLDHKNPMSNVALMNAALANENFEVAYKAAKTANKNLPNQLKTLQTQTKQIMKKFSPHWWKPLSGKNIQLVRISPKHKEFLLSLREDKEFQHHYNLFTSSSKEKLDKDIAAAKKSPLDIKKIEWIIEKHGKPIGIAGLVDLNMHNSRAEIQFGIPDNHSSIYGVEAILLVLEFAFCEIKLHKLVSYVYSDNPHAQSNTLHLGFKQEGFLESHVYDKKENRRLDLYVNGCLAQNFFSNKKLMKLIKRVLGKEIKP